MKTYLKHIMYIFLSLIISSLVITILHYFNIINDSITNILLIISSIASFLIFSNKYSNREKKKTLQICVPIIILLFILSMFICGFELKNLIYFLVLSLITLFPSFINKKIED